MDHSSSWLDGWDVMMLAAGREDYHGPAVIIKTAGLQPDIVSRYLISLYPRIHSI